MRKPKSAHRLKRLLALLTAFVLAAATLAPLSAAFADEVSDEDDLPEEKDYRDLTLEELYSFNASGSEFTTDANGDMWYYSSDGFKHPGNAETADKYETAYYRNREGEFMKFNGEYMPQEEVHKIFWSDPANEGDSLITFKGEWVSLAKNKDAIEEEGARAEQEREARAEQEKEAAEQEKKAEQIATVSFSDVSADSWFFPFISELAPKNYIKGYADNTFRPDNPLLVDEFLTMTLRAMGFDQETAEGYWAENFISEAKSRGLIAEGDFAAYDQPITRGQIAKIVVRAIEAPDNGIDANKSNATAYGEDGFAFSDISGCADEQFIVRAIDNGIIAGYQDQTFKPDNGATRAEASVMVARLIDKSFRLDRYGGVFFCERTDVNDEGLVKTNKTLDFLYEATRKLRFETDINGDAIFRGEMPQAPEGYSVMLSIAPSQYSGGHIDSASTADGFDCALLPISGEFTYNIGCKSEKLALLAFYFNVIKGDTIDNPFDKSGISLLRFIGVSSNKPGYNISENTNGNSGDIDLSFCEALWGW